MAREEPKISPEDSRQPNSAGNSQNVDDLFSPRFKSAAAMAGWDEEALIIASLVVEDTPDRQQSKHKKRSELIFNTPPFSTSRRKRRVRRRSIVSNPIAPLNLEEEEEEQQQISKQENEKESMEEKTGVEDEKKTKVNEPAPLHCMDKLREELSCAICLDICFEPSTTPCGHSFCKKCLRSAADKCGKRCPKCRQLISNGRSCTVNTVLWNTIQLLFPKEVEARKAAGAFNSREVECQGQESGSRSSGRTRTRARVQDPALAERLQREDLARLVNTNTNTATRETPVRPRRENDLSLLVSAGRRRRRGTPGQDEDAALALRLQREEFMEAFRGSSGQNNQQARIPLSLARANLRAMASRAINRGRRAV